MSCGVGCRHGSDLWHRCDCGVGWWLQLRFNPILGISICRGGGPKKTKKKKCTTDMKSIWLTQSNYYIHIIYLILTNAKNSFYTLISHIVFLPLNEKFVRLFEIWEMAHLLGLHLRLWNPRFQLSSRQGEVAWEAPLLACSRKEGFLGKRDCNPLPQKRMQGFLTDSKGKFLLISWVTR